MKGDKKENDSVLEGEASRKEKRKKRNEKSLSTSLPSALSPKHPPKTARPTRSGSPRISRSGSITPKLKSPPHFSSLRHSPHRSRPSTLSFSTSPDPSLSPNTTRTSRSFTSVGTSPSNYSEDTDTSPCKSALTIVTPRSKTPQTPRSTLSSSATAHTRRSSLTIISPRSPSFSQSSSDPPPSTRRSSFNVSPSPSPSPPFSSTFRHPRRPTMPSSARSRSSQQVGHSPTSCPSSARSSASLRSRSPVSPVSSVSSIPSISPGSPYLPSSSSPSPSSSFVSPSIRPSFAPPSTPPPPLPNFPSSFPPPSRSLEGGLDAEKKEKRRKRGSKLFSKKEIHSELELMMRAESPFSSEQGKGTLRDSGKRTAFSPLNKNGANQRSAPQITSDPNGPDSTEFQKQKMKKKRRTSPRRSRSPSKATPPREGDGAFPGIRQHVVVSPILPGSPQNLPMQSPKHNFEVLPLPRPLLSPNSETFLDREERREKQFNEFMNAVDNEEVEEEEEIDEEADDEPLLSLSLHSNHPIFFPDEISFHPIKKENEANEALIIDNGSFFLRAGVNIKNEPNFLIRNTLNLDKYEDEEKILQSFVNAENTKFFDAKTVARQKVEEYFYSINKDSSVNWGHQEDVWEYMFQKLPPSHSSLPTLLSELPMTSPQEREKKAEIFFEKFNVPSLCLLPDCVLNMYNTGKQTGLVVDIGRSVTRITPIYFGSALRYSQRIFQIGSLNLVDHLHSLVCQVDAQAKTISSCEFESYFRNQCYLPLDFSEEFKRTEGMVLKKRYNLYQFPGLRKEIDMGKFRFSAPEPLFKPSILGVSDIGIPQAIQTVVKSLTQIEGLEQEIEQEMLNNIVLTGGGSHVFGLHSRLEKSIQTLYQNEGVDREVNVIAQEGRDLGTWRGGRVVSHFSDFSAMSISMEEFQEIGPRIANWMCPQ